MDVSAGFHKVVTILLKSFIVFHAHQAKFWWPIKLPGICEIPMDGLHRTSPLSALIELYNMQTKQGWEKTKQNCGPCVQEAVPL